LEEVGCVVALEMVVQVLRAGSQEKDTWTCGVVRETRRGLVLHVAVLCGKRGSSGSVKKPGRLLVLTEGVAVPPFRLRESRVHDCVPEAVTSACD
jgi:hypothetical protein